MALQFYNTLTRKKEEFKEIHKGEVGFYSCGPTLYNYPHIGNFRAYVFNDLLKKYLKFKGFKVNHIMNVTDVDDKTIRDSQKEHKTLKEFTEFYNKEFLLDLKTLNIELPNEMPKATDHIKEMIEIIKKLDEKGFAYKAPDGSTYFRISKFNNYGQLANLQLDNLKAGARVAQDEYEKENAQDFALWKSYEETDGDVSWDSSYGRGRPGWHIECSAMSSKHLGNHFDIHTGGIDLMFPHHTNEIAQSEAANGEKFVNYWLHNEHLLVDNKKMSKSLGNFYTLRDLLEKGANPMAIRYLLISNHYRQQLNFTFESIDAATNSIKRLQELVVKLKTADGEKSNIKPNGMVKRFEEAMDDDLNIPLALSVLFEFVRDANQKLSDGKITKDEAKETINALIKIDSVLGVLEFKDEDIPHEVSLLIQQREDARKNKDWKQSDELRGQIKNLGYSIDDSSKGRIIKKL